MSMKCERCNEYTDTIKEFLTLFGMMKVCPKCYEDGINFLGRGILPHQKEVRV